METIRFCLKGVLLVVMLFAFGCNNDNLTPDIRERNSMEDGDDTRQMHQDQDSVNRVLNENSGKAVDTLPKGLQ